VSPEALNLTSTLADVLDPPDELTCRRLLTLLGGGADDARAS
jgi:hypothetical protein